MDIMKHSFENYILSTKTVDSDSEKWAQIKYNVYRFIGFSELKYHKPIGLLDFSVLKSSDLMDFSVLSLHRAKVQRSGGLYHFSKVKYSNLVEFNSVTLYHTKIWQFSRTLTLYYDKVDHNCRTLTLYYAKVHQSSKIFMLYHFTALKYTVLVDFTLLKCYSSNVVTCYYGSRLKRGPPAIAPPVSALPGSIYGAGKLGCELGLASWKLGASCELASCELC